MGSKCGDELKEEESNREPYAFADRWERSGARLVGVIGCGSEFDYGLEKSVGC